MVQKLQMPFEWPLVCADTYWHVEYHHLDAVINEASGSPREP